MRINPGPLLAQRTTLKLGGRTIAEVVVEHERDVERLSDELQKLGGNPLVLGEGSNILAADHELPVVLVCMTRHGPPEQRPQDDDGSVTVRVPGELRLPRLLGWLGSRGLSGLEELTGIPGSLGGAVAMNAGSYGREMGQVLRRVLVWTPEEGVVWREFGQWRAGYRYFDAALKGAPVLILAADLRLQHDAQDAIRARMRRIYARKKSSQPVTMASAGCVFKNPSPDQPAGQLLDQARLRGRRLGNMAFSERHANFLVNLGGGRSEDALELLELARGRIHDLFGLRLETEVKVIA